MAQKLDGGDLKSGVVGTSVFKDQKEPNYSGARLFGSSLKGRGSEISEECSYGDTDKAMSQILQAQVDQVEHEKKWNDEAITALKNEVNFDGDETQLKEQVRMSDYEWSRFLHEWRRKFDVWGKRVLDLSQCQDYDDRAKSACLLVETYRRLVVLANCKAHMMKLLDKAGKGHRQSTTKNDDTKEEK